MNFKISVITVVRNAAGTIEQTIKSVLSQSYPFVEYIVLDGQSNDGTLEIIQKYKQDIHFIRSEKDSGIYDAMNKGIRLTTGELIVLLNADDYFTDNCIQNVINKYNEIGKKECVIFGDAFIYYEEIKQSALRKCKIAFSRGMTIIHQAMFVHKKVYEKTGVYDLSFKNAADFDFTLRTYLTGVPYIHIPYPLVYSRRSEQRTSEKFAEISIKEEKMILKRHYKRLGVYYFYRNLLFTRIRENIHKIIVRIFGKNTWLWIRHNVLIYIKP